jgi:hypothetical protein
MSKSDHHKNTKNPPSWFKKDRRQKERARANQAVREAALTDDGPDTLTRKHSDRYDWN